MMVTARWAKSVTMMERGKLAPPEQAFVVKMPFAITGNSAKETRARRTDEDRTVVVAAVAPLLILNLVMMLVIFA